MTNEPIPRRVALATAKKNGIYVDNPNGKRWLLCANGVRVTYWPATGQAQAYGLKFRMPFDVLINHLAAGTAVPRKGDRRYRYSQCNSCRRDVIWLKADPGKGRVKSQILDLDGQSHWATCPHADHHRRSAARQARSR